MSEPDGQSAGLIELIDELRRDGFRVSTEQYVAAMKLAVLLAVRSELSVRPEEWGQYLAPVLCTSAEEQASFSGYFVRWLAANPHAFAALKHTAERDSLKGSNLTVRLKRWRQRSGLSWLQLSLWLLTFLALPILIAFGIAYVRRPPAQHTLTVNVVNTGGPLMLSLSGAQYSDQRNLNGDGKVIFVYTQDKLPLSVSASTLEGVVKKAQVIDQAGQLAPITFDLAAASESPSPSRSLRPLIWTAAVIGAVCLLYLGMRFIRYRCKLELKKERTRQDLRTEQLVVKGVGEQLTQLFPLRRTAQELRRHLLLNSTELDVDRTLDGTIRKGLFTPSYAPRRTSPEYLVLIDRAALDDQRARLANEIMDRLTKNGVFVERYYFQGDPRVCRRDCATARNLTLADLAGLYPVHFLMIFSDGVELFDPLTGNPRRWIQMFAPWTAPCLLTSEIRPGDYRASALRETGFVVAPADGNGILAYSNLIHNGTQNFEAVRTQPKPLPELMRARPTRWIEEHPPVPETLRDLCVQLQEFLGDECFYWLSACAVFPKLYWDLTLYLGYKLIDHDNFDKKVSALVRLPWFRDGSIPDWLREVLVTGLPKAEECEVRDALTELLASSTKNPEGFVLLISRAPQQVKEGFLKKRWTGLVSKWRKRRQINTVLDNLDAGSYAPLKDHLLVSFMSGRGLGKLAAAVPDEVREILNPQSSSPVEYFVKGLVFSQYFFSAALIWVLILATQGNVLVVGFSTCLLAAWVTLVRSLLQVQSEVPKAAAVGWKKDSLAGLSLPSGEWQSLGTRKQKRAGFETGTARSEEENDAKNWQEIGLKTPPVEPVARKANSIFICYRRGDSTIETHRIYDRLAQRFGEKTIFIDLASLPPGADFRQYIESVVSECDVMLVVIGGAWLSQVTDSDRSAAMRRIDDPHDLVRIEIETALRRDIPVIPLLVNNARVPRPEDLPPPIQNLGYRQFLPVGNDQSFDRDIARLARHLEGVASREFPARPTKRRFFDSLIQPILSPLRVWRVEATDALTGTRGDRVVNAHDRPEVFLWLVFTYIVLTTGQSISFTISDPSPFSLLTVLIWGVALAIVQMVLWRPYLPMSRSWVLATTVGAIVSAGAGYLFFQWWLGWFDLRAWVLPRTLLALLRTGWFIVSLSQWLRLRKLVDKAWLWPAATFVTSLGISLIFTAVTRPEPTPDEVHDSFIVYILCSGLLLGGAHGLCLFYFRHFPNRALTKT
jgi:hypothetical protein